MIQILYWDNWGNLEITNSKYTYKYFEVFESNREKIKQILRSKKPNKVWTYLKPFKYIRIN